MKITTVAARFSPFAPKLRCPLCGAPIALSGASFVCERAHCFDLSAKGYVNFAPGVSQAQPTYEAALFDARAEVLDGGFYRPVMDVVEYALESRFGDSFSAVDVGCGEGAYARDLALRYPSAAVLGLDISRYAIMRACQTTSAARFVVGDLKRLPLADGAFDTVLNILTPADYDAFQRVLRPGGVLVKVIPGANYLREIRAYAADQLPDEPYTNERVVSHLQAHARVLERIDISRTYDLTAEQAHAFLHMTPLTARLDWSALPGEPPRQATVHLEVFICSLES